MICNKCGKEIDDGSKFCAECGESIEEVIQSETFVQPTAEKAENNAVEVLKVTRIIAKGDLSIFSDRIEFAYLSDNIPVTEVYHYFNIKNASADNGLKIASLVIETVDDNKMFFTIDNENSFDVCTQKAALINQTKAACPALGLLGLTEEDMKNELNENKEKRKGKAGKKIENFISEYNNFKSMSKEEQQEAVEQTKEKAKDFAKKEKENYKNFKSLSTKQKLIRIAVPVLVLIILINIFGGGSGNNSHVIKAESSDGYGNVAFDLTFEEFIENYNACIDKDEEYESVATMRYLNADDFNKNVLNGGVIEYAKNFGTYYSALATLYIYVNPNTDTIQFIEYKWKRSGYNTDDAEFNYYYKLPATIFSMLDDSVDFPFNGDVSSYEKTYDEIADEDIVVRGDSFYNYMSADESTHSIVFTAATKNSACYKAQKDL